MLRITKITDYGVLLLTRLADAGARGTRNARDLADELDLPLPTVSKILKTLTRAGLLASHRGARGGYALTRRPEQISITEVITALDGPVALTRCGAEAEGCPREELCGVSANWQIISDAVRAALEKITLAEMVRPASEFEKWLGQEAWTGGNGSESLGESQ